MSMVTVQTKMPPELRDEAQAQADRECDGNLSMITRRALRAYLARAPLRDYPQEDADVHA